MTGRYAMVHNNTTCREVAFFYDKQMGPKDLLQAEHAIYPGGERPARGQPIICHNCGEQVVGSELVAVYQEQEMPKPKNVILVDSPMLFGHRMI